MTRLIVLTCLVLAAATAWADAPPAQSLFLSADDAALAEKLAAGTAKPGTADIALDAIMYYGPDDWSVWLQGRRRAPANRDEAPRILAVSSDRVTLVVAGDDGAPDRTISLRAGERYQLASGAITRF